LAGEDWARAESTIAVLTMIDDLQFNHKLLLLRSGQLAYELTPTVADLDLHVT